MIAQQTRPLARRNRARRIVATFAILPCFACAPRGVPGPAVPTSKTYQWEAGEEKRSGTGQLYCDDVERYTRRSGSRYSALGWTFSVFATTAAATPAAITAAAGDDKLTEAEKVLNVGLPVLAGLFAAGAVASFTRGDHANEVAKAASLGAAESDSASAAKVCIKAIADWNGQRGAASKAVQEIQKQEVEDQVKKEVEANESEKEALEKQNAALEKQNAALERENADLKKKK